MSSVEDDALAATNSIYFIKNQDAAKNLLITRKKSGVANVIKIESSHSSL